MFRMRSIWGTVLALALVAASAQAEDNVWTLGPRILPPPANASPQLKAILAGEPTPELKVMRGKAPTNLGAWKELIAIRDEEGAGRARKIAKEMDVAVREDRIAGVPVYWVDPPRVSPQHKNHLFVHVHGGAWLFGGGLGATAEAVLIAARDGIPVLSIDYRRAPQFPHPAAMDDVVAVWTELLKTRAPSQMALGGASAAPSTLPRRSG